MRALRALAVRYPVRTTFVVALAVRLMVVISSHVLNQWPLIPDEMGYVELATLAADGRTNDYCCGGYGNNLYQSTRLFTWQIHGLVELFGPVGWILQQFADLGICITRKHIRGTHPTRQQLVLVKRTIDEGT